MRRTSFITALTLVCAAASASAQLPAPTFRQTLGTNLLAIPFGVFSVDHEHAVGTGGFAVGLGALHTAVGDGNDDDDFRVTWAQAKLKYYPGETTLRGVAVGITAGVVQDRDNEYVYALYDPMNPTSTPPTRVRRKDTAATIGVVVDYNWLLGREERFLFGIGVGAKRVLKDVGNDNVIFPGGGYSGDRSPLQQVYPDGRFTVGFAF